MRKIGVIILLTIYIDCNSQKTSNNIKTNSMKYFDIEKFEKIKENRKAKLVITIH